ncbi:MAG: hypothetical protein B7Z38_02410 [Rhodobacterales bacterium 12-64-8]|nr:MAG: hypothetical protein B7Z38_02410 [Rhodobacterales bacterium 12-64-8]OYX50232.1 MAG: hypothetical protein B7Y90_04420 [Alphaproteobacteria bacterium 32-64-14]
MLDKGQIKDWDGKPEDGDKPAAPAAKADIASMILAPRQAVATGERVTLTPEQVTARKRRGQWIALALFAFVILVFVLTMTKLGANVMVRDL